MKYALDPEAAQEELNDFLDTLPWIPRHIRIEDLERGCYCASCVHFCRIEVDTPWWS